MATIFVDSEDTEVELVDMTADDHAGFILSSPTLRAPSSDSNTDDTLIDDGSRELDLAQDGTLTGNASCGEGTNVYGDIREGRTTLKREPLSNIDVPIQMLSLSELREPPLCKLYPDRRDEILRLFLRRTTFTVEVWTNYTAVDRWTYKDGCEFFHDEKRVRDCGRLRLRNKDTLEHIRLLDPGESEMMKVNVAVGTPFRPLLRLVFVMGDGNLMISGYHETDDTHTELHDFVHECYDEILNVGLIHGKKGVTVQDLECYASLFVKKPPER
ncbi:hypothetical protein K431DRAFT_293477 [Polychaeton citri CBS 116435]|uniref:Uncharacterized protein n=1 Tax=Polychaeton citri CBS 116435 TaxID=1314669 RepID=A0A9P4UR86_9PEZI|nr:hypothetical protein K431DRAFT_293477 [Polychaeton citri CBS 116435]